MLVLLPPSESKTSPGTGAPVSLTHLSHPHLTDARRMVGDTLARVSARRNAVGLLGVPPSLGAEVRHNATLWTNPSAAAASVYSGVLYDAARMAAWPEPMMARGRERIRIVSALWGTVSPADRIPAYRLSMGTTLPRIGALASFWKRTLPDTLGPLADGGVVVDCRSSAYVPPFRPADAPWVTVRVERDVNGVRSVISHMAKHTRGVLTAHLMTHEVAPSSTQDVADAAAAMIGNALVDVQLVARPKGPDELTLVIAG